jgi:protocatechuate 3,4-dioxygenase beta subunit
MKRTPNVRAGALSILLLVAAPALSLAGQASAAEQPGSVSGKVTVDGKPAAASRLMLTRNLWEQEGETTYTATAGEDGAFRFAGVAPGRYHVVTDTPSYIAAGSAGTDGVTVIVGDGEDVAGVAVTLRHGGVITGRLTDKEGAPIAWQRVSVFKRDETGKKQEVNMLSVDQTMTFTDDRGVYRIYGLAPGTYLVAAGEANEGDSMSIGSARKLYDRHFYPGASDEAEARPVEVTSGGEATGIDIELSAQTKTYRASGRVVDAETGAPIKGVMCGYTQYVDDRAGSGFAFSGLTGAKGEFSLSGLRPGRYAALAMPQDESVSAYFADTAPFEVVASDVESVVVKMRRGGSISGRAVVEGASGPSAALLKTYVRTNPVAGENDDGMGFIRAKSAPIAADGAFTVTGIPPGSYTIELAWSDPVPPFALLRVERDGAPTREPFVVEGGETIGDVTVVLAAGTASVRGHVAFSGERPADSWAQASLTREDTGAVASNTDVGDDGRFLFERVPAGVYTVTVALSYQSSDRKPVTAKGTVEHVTVGATGRSDVEVAVDLRGGKGEDR